MLGFLSGVIAGLFLYVVARVVLAGFFTVQQNERAVLVSFGRAERIEGRTSLDTPVAEHLNEEQRDRYRYPLVKVIGPGGPYHKWPWQKVHKVDVAIQTVNAAYDPEVPSANYNNTMLDAVTKDQLNIGIRGQLRYRVSEENLYAYLFGVRHPIAHVMGYFVSVLRERIATFQAKSAKRGQRRRRRASGGRRRVGGARHRGCLDQRLTQESERGQFGDGPRMPLVGGALRRRSRCIAYYWNGSAR